MPGKVVRAHGSTLMVQDVGNSEVNNVDNIHFLKN